MINLLTDEHGLTPLYTACIGGHMEVVKELLRHSELDLNKVDESMSH